MMADHIATKRRTANYNRALNTCQILLERGAHEDCTCRDLLGHVRSYLKRGELCLQGNGGEVANPCDELGELF